MQWKKLFKKEISTELFEIIQNFVTNNFIICHQKFALIIYQLKIQLRTPQTLWSFFN